MKFPDDLFEKMRPQIEHAFAAKRELEAEQSASKLLEPQKQAREEISAEGKTAEQIARPIDADPEDVFHLLRHLAGLDSQSKVARGEEAVDDRVSLAESS